MSNNGATVRSTGTGATAANILLTGTGGSGTSLGVGVHVDSATITTVDGDIQINGFGAVATGNYNIGFDVFSSTGVVSSTGTGASAGTITINGTGGSGTNDNAGVFLDGGGRVTSVDGAVQVTGTALDSTGTAQNGIHFETSGALTTTGTATTFLTGTAGNTSSVGIALLNPSTITLAGATNNFIADSMSIATTGATINAGNKTVTLRQKTNGNAIRLGGADAAGTLGLTDAELDKITAGTINIGDSNSGTVTVIAGITRAAATNLNITTGGNNGISFSGSTALINAGGGNVTLATNSGGSGGIFSGAAATDVTAATISLSTGSAGIGASGNPINFDATNLNASTGGNGNQFLNTANVVTIDATGLSAGTGTINLFTGNYVLGGSDRIANASDVNVSGAVLDLVSNTDTIDQLILTGGGAINTVSTLGTGTLTGNSDFDVRSGSVLTALAGSVGLTKTTAGTVILGQCTYSGPTLVNGGALLVNGSLSPASAVTVNSTGILAGTGTVGGTVQVTSGGLLAPGTSPGILNTGICQPVVGDTRDETACWTWHATEMSPLPD